MAGSLTPSRLASARTESASAPVVSTRRDASASAASRRSPWWNCPAGFRGIRPRLTGWLVMLALLTREGAHGTGRRDGGSGRWSARRRRAWAAGYLGDGAPAGHRAVDAGVRGALRDAHLGALRRRPVPVP